MAIAPQEEVHNLKLIEDKRLNSKILSDPGSEVAQLYGITFEFPENLKEVYLRVGIDLQKCNGDDSWTLPLPTRLIIDQDRFIRCAPINSNYTVRPDPEETIAVVKSIVAKLS